VTRAHRASFALPLRRTLALIAVSAVALTACGSGAKKAAESSSAPPSNVSSSTAPSSDESASTAPSPTAKPVPVHVSLLESDGGTFGVGMPIIAYFTKTISDSSAFLKATTVKIDGQPAAGAWYFEKSARPGNPLEAHYRLQGHWPAHTQLQMDMPVEGLSGGGNFVFQNSLTLSMAIGADHSSTVDAATLRMQVFADGKLVKTMPVSLGKASTPTYNGVKVVMERDKVQHMVGTPDDPYSLLVPWSVRMTNSGEFIHSASWNGGNIGSRSTSNGCTNLNTADAQWFYNFAVIGDVVTYVNTNGGPMPTWDGYGDWNLAWSTWKAGGIVQSSDS
jgi:lipoprotein-anchoring transpeptidase ErfK/SrfK